MRTSIVVDSLSEAIADIQDGMTVALGGFLTASKPMALVKEMVRKGLKDLTIIANPSSIDVDLLIGMGCVKRLLVPYVGAESLAPVGPFFRHAVQNQTVELIEIDEGIILTMLRAVKQGVPFLPWKGGLGTSIPEMNPYVKVGTDPFEGEPVLFVQAMQPDVALIHAAHADPYGNVQHLGNAFADPLLSQVAKQTIVQVERIVPETETKKAPQLTTIASVYVDKVVRAPFGAHPFFSQRHYVIDKKHIRLYIEAATAYLKGDKAMFEQYLQDYVYCSHGQYLSKVAGENLLTIWE